MKINNLLKTALMAFCLTLDTAPVAQAMQELKRYKANKKTVQLACGCVTLYSLASMSYHFYSFFYPTPTQDGVTQYDNLSSLGCGAGMAAVAQLFGYGLYHSMTEDDTALQEQLLYKNLNTTPALLQELDAPLRLKLTQRVVDSEDLPLIARIAPYIEDYDLLLNAQAQLQDKNNFIEAYQLLNKKIHGCIQLQIDQDILSLGTNLPRGVVSLITDYVEL